MDCCYMDWADGAWLRGYIRDCDWGWSKEIPREIDFWREIPACMLKGRGVMILANGLLLHGLG